MKGPQFLPSRPRVLHGPESLEIPDLLPGFSLDTGRLSSPKGVIRIEGAGGAVGGVGSPAFGASGVPYQAVAICVYAQPGEVIQLDTTRTPKDNPPFTKCSVTIPSGFVARKKVAGVFKFSLKHRRLDSFSVIESTGNETTDSAIVAAVLRQGFWTSDRYIQPERIAYIVRLGQ